MYLIPTEEENRLKQIFSPYIDMKREPPLKADAPPEAFEALKKYREIGKRRYEEIENCLIKLEKEELLEIDEKMIEDMEQNIEEIDEKYPNVFDYFREVAKRKRDKKGK